MQLRPHQQIDLEAMRVNLRKDQSTLLVAPCGYGKGTICTVIVKSAVEKGKRIIFAVHGKALVNDMSQRVEKLGIRHGVLMGGHKRQRWEQVQVASIDTLHRLDPPPTADLIICDEVHMALSDTWRKTLAKYPTAKIIGMTATPIRLDKKGLGRASGGLFDSMVVGPSEQELIDMGYLMPSFVLAPPPPSGAAGIHKTAGEFNPKEQSAVFDKSTIIGDIVEHFRKHGSGRKTAVFGVDQAHAFHIKEKFSEAGFNWAYVDAKTSDDERAKIWRDLDYGDLLGVSSVGCISVGWDHPIVSCLIMARMTASLGLWRQMLGRGSRPHPGKKNFLVLDHVGGTWHHHPYGLFESEVEWSLDGEAIKIGPKKPPPVTTCKTPVKHPDGSIQLPCYATFRSGPSECPYCGIILVKKKADIKVREGDLVEIGSMERPVGPVRYDLLNAYLEYLRVQHERSYKSGYAKMQYFSRFKRFPSRDVIAAAELALERERAISDEYKVEEVVW